jgi:predicted nucleic acid-binding protein
MILLDTNVILDVWDRDPVWHAWSRDQMRKLSRLYDLTINPIIYAEVSARYSTLASLDEHLDQLGIIIEGISREAAFLAGKAYSRYRSRGGIQSNVLPDFFIGAHATVLRCPLVTRDTRRYSAYFPTVQLITPQPGLC